MLDIRLRRIEFMELAASVATFCSGWLQFPLPPSQFGAPASSPPTVQQLMRQIHAELGHPHLSLREKRQLEDAENVAASLNPQGEVTPNGNKETGESNN